MSLKEKQDLQILIDQLPEPQKSYLLGVAYGLTAKNGFSSEKATDQPAAQD